MQAGMPRSGPSRFAIAGWLVILEVMIMQASASHGESGSGTPITVQMVSSGRFATFTNRLHPGNRIGYRFFEHSPLTHGEVPRRLEDAAIDPAETSRRVAAISARPGLQQNRVAVEGEGWAPHHWTYYMAPADDEIDLLLVVETAEKGLNAYYGIQQCFRMGGKTNETWRRAIAETPAFSEYDLWRLLEKDRSAKTSLTHVLRQGAWLPLPPTPGSIGARTLLGVRIDTERSGGKLSAMPEVGPYAAQMTDPTDCGLIARRSTDSAWVCGIYWERTSHVTDHHPADCLHTIVNIGGVPPNSRRAIRGKIYWLEGSLDELRERWAHDFPPPSQ